MGTTQVTIREAKARLYELGELAQTGERIVIVKSGKPYLELRAHRESQGKRCPGRLTGQIRIAPDFDAIQSNLLPGDTRP